MRTLRMIALLLAKQNFYRKTWWMLSLGLWLSLGPVAFGQGSARMVFSRVPSVLPSPYVADLQRDYNFGSFPMQFVFSAPTRNAVSFRFAMELTLEGQLLFSAISEPVAITPGVYTYRTFRDAPAIIFPVLADLIALMPADVQASIRQTGTLPEGAYELTMEPIPADESFVDAQAATARFSVVFPEAPNIISPADEANVTQANPSFVWNSVGVPAGETVEYQVVGVEILQGQTLAEAFRGNRPHFESAWMTENRFVYSGDLLPLEAGHRYAWNVKARTRSGLPISNNGQSEIFSFGYQTAMRTQEVFTDVSRIVLEPSFAALSDLGDLRVTESLDRYILNGTATLTLQASTVQTMLVEVADLQIERGDLRNPVVLGGRLSYRIPDGENPFSRLTNDLLVVRQLVWAFGGGFSVEAALQLPNNTRATARGTLRLTRTGLAGELVVENGGRPVFSFGGAPFSVALNRLTARFPEGRLTGQGGLSLFGSGEICEIPAFDFGTGLNRALINCRLSQTLPLVSGSNLLSLSLAQVSGTLAFDPNTGQVRPSLTLNGGLNFQPEGHPPCTSAVALDVAPDRGFSLQSFTNGCRLPRLSLGMMEMTLDQLRLPRLNFDPARNLWDFALQFNAQLSGTMFGGLQLPVLPNLNLSAEGLQIPSISLDEAALAGLGNFSLGWLQARLTGLRAPSLNLNPFSPSATAWDDLRFDLALQIPSLAGMPACLQRPRFNLRDLSFAGSAFRFELPEVRGDGCTVPLGTAALNITNISGVLNGSIRGAELVASPEINLEASLRLASPFSCSGAPIGIPARFRLDASGRISGRVPSFPTSDCSLSLGFGLGRLSDLALDLGERGGRQTALLTGGAALRLNWGTGVNATGTVTMDLFSGSLETYRFDLESGFALPLPTAEQPWFTFNIGASATLDPTGLRLNGTHHLESNGVNFPANFRNFLTNPANLNIEDGFIELGAAERPTFQLVYDIGTARFRVLPIGEPLPSGNLFALQINQAQIGANGLALTGEAVGVLNFGGRSLGTDQLRLRFSDFALGMNPVRVNRGAINFLVGGVVVAVYDASGFRLEPSGLLAALPLPAQLPLPNSNIAYLRLRSAEGAPLLIDHENLDGGRIRIRSRVGQPIALVFPSLAGGRSVLPEINASFDLVLNNGDFSVQSISSFNVAAAPEFNRAVFGTAPMRISRWVLAGVGGGLSLAADIEANLPTALSNDPLEVRNLRISERGFEEAAVSAMINLPNGTRGMVSGLLSVDALGLRGELRLDSPFTISQPNFSLNLTGLSLQFPNAILVGRGGVSLFGGQASCALPSFSFGVGGARGRLDCALNESFNLVPASSLATLELRRIQGEFQFDGSRVRPALQVESRLSLAIENGPRCGTALTLSLAPDGSFSTQNVTPDCTGLPQLHLGALSATLANLRLPTLSFDALRNRWNFELSFDSQLITNSLGLQTLPVVAGFRLRPEGLTIPSINFNESQLAGLRPFNLGGAQARFTAFSLNSFVLNWFDLGEGGLGNWDANLGLRLSMADGSGLPSCLQDARFDTMLRLNGSRLAATLTTAPLTGCSLPLGPARLNLTRIGGSLEGTYAGGGFSFDPSLRVGGSLTLTEALGCSESLGLGDADLSILGNGFITGTVVATPPPTCGLRVGTFRATLGRTALVFGQSGGRPSLVMDGLANLRLDPETAFNGTYNLDLIGGRLNAYRFALTAPFTLNLPQDRPALQFRIQTGELTENGLLLDGLNRLLLGDTAVNAHFERVRFNTQTWGIEEGAIRLEGGLSLEAGLSGEGLNFRAQAENAPSISNPGVTLRLGSGIRFDRTGMTLAGRGSAALNYRPEGGETMRLPRLEADFGSGFNFSLNPFNVQAGRVNLGDGGRALGYVDATGFHLDPAYLVDRLLPARLPLPSNTIAYLNLQRDGRSLVEATTTERGLLNLNVRRGETVDLVFPALARDGRTPTIGVTFSNILVDPVRFNIVGGSLQVDVSRNPDFNLPEGVPLKLNELVFGERSVDGRMVLGLFLNGNLRFGTQDLGARCPVSFHVTEAGMVQGQVACMGMESIVPLQAGFDLAQLQFTGANGSVQLPLPGFSGAANVALRFEGGLNLRNGTGASMGRLGFTASFDGSRFALTTTADGRLGEGLPHLELGVFNLGLTRLADLSLAWEGGRLRFGVTADLRFGIRLPDGTSLNLPVIGAHIGSDGFRLPRLDLTGRALSDLGLRPFSLGPMQVNPTQIRIPSFSLSSLENFGRDLLGLLPTFNLEASFPSLAAQSPDFAAARIPFTNLGLRNGLFIGTFGGEPLPGDGYAIPFGSADAGLRIRQVGVRLFDDSGRQGVEINLNGNLRYPTAFGDTRACRTDLTAQLDSAGDLLAQVSGLAPCGGLTFGPLQVAFTTSNLELQLGRTNRADLDGRATAILTTRDGVLRANGELGINLLNGAISRSNITLTGPFAWGVPAENPYLLFTVNSARLDTDGLTFNGGGDLNVGIGQTLGVRFNDAKFGFNGSLLSGNVGFTAPFAFDIPLDGGRWQISMPTAADPLGNFFRLNLPSGLGLDATGFTVNGAARAKLRYGSEFFGDTELGLAFSSFRFNFSPFGVNAGRVDLNLSRGGTTTRVAYYDATGFHPDNLLGALPLPARLPLPELTTAYLQLRDMGGALLLNSSDEGGGRLRIGTRLGQPIQLVFPALQGTNPTAPSVPVEFEFVLNSGDFSIIEVARFSAGAAEVLNRAVFGSTPIQLQRLDLTGSGRGIALLADLRIALPASVSSDPLNLTGIRITDRGFEAASVSVRLNMPSGAVNVTGHLMGGTSLSGTLTLANGGRPILNLGTNPLTASLSSLNLQFPAARLEGVGNVSLFGGETTCPVTSFVISGEENSIALSCRIDQRFPMVPGTTLMTLGVQTISGNLQFNGRTGAFGYDLTMNGDLALAVAEGPHCGSALTVSLSSARGFSARDVRPNCAGLPQLNLGFLNLGFNNLSLPRLNFDTVRNAWDFEVGLNALLSSASLGNVQLPELPVRITPNGIQFNPFSFDATALAGLRPFNLGFANARLMGARLARPFTFDWFRFDGSDGGAWDLAFDLRLSLPASPSLPDCIEEAALNLNNLRFSGAGVSFSSEASVLRGVCRIPMGPAQLNVTQLSATLDGRFSAGSFNLNPTVNIGASLALGAPFNCAETDAPTTLGTTALRIGTSGILEGSIMGLAPSCPLRFGTYAGRVTSAGLTFSNQSGRQGLVLNGGASLQFSPRQSVSGNFELDLMAGRFNRYEFNLNEPFDWSVPAESPVFSFRVNTATLNQTGLRIDGRSSLQFDGAPSLGVTFDNFLFNLNTGAIDSGRIVFDAAFGFRAGINDATNQLSYGAVPLDHRLTLSPGALLKMSGSLVIDRTGLAVTGTADAALQYRDWNLDRLRLQYSDGFRFSFSPFGVAAGNMTIEHDGTRLATISSSGISIDPAFVTALLPDRLPVPHTDVAYLEIRRGGRLLIDVTRTEGGTYRLASREPINLVVPSLRGSGAPPSFPVTFTGFEIDPRDFRVRAGYFSVAVGEAVRRALPADFPILPTELGYGIQVLDGRSVDALFVSGTLRVMNASMGEACPIRAIVQMDGILRSTMRCSGLDVNIPLQGNNHLAVLRVQQVDGSVSIPLVSGSPSFALNVQGGFRVRTQDNPTAPIAAETEVTAEFTHTGFRLTGSMPRPIADPPRIDLGVLALGINRIDRLSLAYAAGRFTFNAGLEVQLRVGLQGGSHFELPSYGIELSDRGLTFAALDLNSGSTPPLRISPFALGPVSIQPLAFRMPAVTLDFFSGSITGLNPRFDLELTLPSFSTTAPALAGARISLNDVGIENGVFLGSIVPYTPEGGILRVPISRDVNFGISRATGRFFNDVGRQGVEVQFAGNLVYPSLNRDRSTCSATITAGFTSRGGFEARASGLAPCGELNFDPVRLRFVAASLDLAFGNGTGDRANFSGTAEATVRRDGVAPLTARGTLGLNLLTGDVMDANIEVTGPFTWNVPSEAPVFSFTVNTARLDRDGILLNGAGQVRVGDGSVRVRFNSPHFRFRDFSLVSGNIQFESDLAFNVGLEGSPSFSLISNATPLPSSGNVFRLGLPANLQLDAAGISVNGTATAQLRFGTEMFTSLGLSFSGFGLAVNPMRVTTGSVDLMLRQTDGASTRLAYFDRDGFHPDNLVAAIPLPARLGLPTASVAYLQLRSGPSTTDPLVIATQDLGGGRMRIYTREGAPAQVVFASFAGQPSAGVAFDMEINTSDFSIQRVTSFNVSLSPSLNTALFGSFPLQLLRFGLSGSGGSLAFMANARVNLPSSLSGLPLEIENLRISSAGFENATVRLGTYSNEYQDACRTTPIRSFDISGGSILIAACGVELVLGSSGVTSLRFSGQLGGTFLTSNTGAASRLQLTGEVAGGTWRFNASASHLSGGNIQLGFATLQPISLGLTANDSEFTANLSGVFRVPSMGPDFAVTIEELQIGTRGVSFGRAELTSPQTFRLFNNALTLNVNRLGLLAPSGGTPLRLRMSGNATFMEQTGLAFTDLTIGTDGRFSLGSGDLNLLAGGRSLNLIPDILALNTLRLGVSGDVLTLNVGGNVTLPNPMEGATAPLSVAMSLNTRTGVVTVPPTTVGFSLDPTGRLNSSPLELGLGSFATIEPTGVQLTIDWTTPRNSVFYASGNIYIQNDNAKIVQLGQSTALTTNYGIRVGFDGSLSWRITNTPNFTFTTDFFEIQIQASTPSNTPSDGFRLVINGQAGLRLPGLGGVRAGFSGFTIGSNGIEDVGRFSGPFSVQLMNIASLTIGDFRSGSGELTYTCQSSPGGSAQVVNVASGSGAPESRTCRVMTDRYVVFDGGVSLSLGSTFSGGVDRILYFKTATGTYFALDNFNVNLQGTGNLRASMEYLSEGGDYLLRAAGSGTFSTVGFDFVGRFQNRSGRISFGLFAFVRLPMPIIPGVITLTGVGAGFFYRPDPTDTDLVMRTIRFDNPNPFPTVGSDFMLLFAADAGIVGGAGGPYAATVRLVIRFAAGGDGWALSIRARGSIFNQSQERFNAYFALDVVQAGERFTVNGTVAVNLDYTSVITGNASVTFNVIKQGGAEAVWAINGAINNFNIVRIIRVNGSFVVCNDGFYFDLTAGGGFDFWIISVTTSLNIKFWWNRPREAFGAYVRFGIRASVLGGLAELGATAEGALIRDGSNFLIYGAASGYVKVLFVFEGTIRLWIACLNGQWDGGEGSGDSRYRQMIEDAQQQAQDMANAAQSAASQLQAAQSAPNILGLTEEQLLAAGLTLQQMNQTGRALFGYWTISRENTYNRYILSGGTPPAPAAYQNVVDQVVGAAQTDISTYELTSTRTTMETRLRDLSRQAPRAISRLQSVTTQAVEFQSETDRLDTALRNPVQSLRLTWSDGDTPPNFEIDESADDENQTRMQTFRTQVAALDAQYQNSIAAVVNNINRLDDLITGEPSFAVETLLPAVRWSPLAVSKQRLGILSPVQKAASPPLSINELASLYRQTLESIFAFYGHNFSYLWKQRNQYVNRLNALNSSRTGIQNAVNAQTSAGNGISALPGRSGATKTAMLDLAEARRQMTLFLANGGTNEAFDQATTDAAAFRATLTPTALSNVAANLTNTGTELWINIHDTSLNNLISTADSRAASEYATFSSRLTTTLAPFEDFTDTIDNLYNIKVRMMTTLFGMLDEYIAWRTTTLRTTDHTTWTAQRAALAQKLEPPAITSITVTPNKLGGEYYNRALVAWSATHPTGVVEYAFSFDGGGDSDIRSGQGFLTSGIDHTFTYVAFKTATAENSKTIGFRIRARGEGGNTVIRGVQFRANVGEGGVLTNGGTSSGSVLSFDVSAPYMNGINFPENNITSETVTSLRTIRTIDGRAFTEPSVETVRRAWLNQTDRVTVQVSAEDPQSDIGSVEYAIGTTLGGTNVRNWTTLQGTRSREADEGVVTTATIRGLNLLEGQEYYLSARAFNGQGAVSSLINHRFVVDLTRPSPPRAAYRAVPYFAPVYTGYTPPNNAPFAYDQSVMFEAMPSSTPARQTPSALAWWSSATDEAGRPLSSGVRQYRYLVSRTADPNGLTVREESTTTTRLLEASLSGTPLNFRDAFYVHVWAEDFANNRSTPFTFGPFTPADPTNPTRPVGRGKLGTTNLYLTQESVDPESGIRGYQYAIGTALGRDDLRPWPSGNTVDYTAIDTTPEVSGELYVFRTFGVSPTAIRFTATPEGTPAYLHLRAMNHQGNPSSVVASGVIITDTTRPTTSGVTASYNRSTGFYTISINNMLDAQSGIAKVEYRILNEDGSVLMPYQEVRLEGLRSALSRTYTVYRYGDRNLNYVTIEARITNSVGLQTTTSTSVTIIPRVTGGYYFYGF